MGLRDSSRLQRFKFYNTKRGGQCALDTHTQRILKENLWRISSPPCFAPFPLLHCYHYNNNCYYNYFFAHRLSADEIRSDVLKCAHPYPHTPPHTHTPIHPHTDTPWCASTEWCGPIKYPSLSIFRQKCHFCSTSIWRFNGPNLTYG